MSEGAEWPADSPEGAITRFLAEAEAEDWAAAATWIDPIGGPEFAEERRRHFMERVRAVPLTAETYQRLYPSASPDVVNWHVAQHAEAVARRPNEVAETFAGVHTEAELMALQPAELVRPLLEAADLRYRMRLAYAAHGYPVHPAAEAVHQPRSLRILGHLAERSDCALVIFRAVGKSEGGEIVLGSAEVIEVRRRDGARWGLPLNHDLTAAGHGSVFMFGATESRQSETPEADDA